MWKGFAAFALLMARAVDAQCPSTAEMGYLGLLRCIEENAPVLLRAGAGLREGEASVGQARERINPTLNLQGLKSTGNDPSGDSISGSILFPLDLGGVRSARVAVAELDLERQKLSRELQLREILGNAYLSLHRIRQLQAELRLLEATSRSLKASLEAFSRRPKLSSEQEATRQILEMAKFETGNRLEITRQERDGIVHDLSVLLGAPWEPNEKDLPIVPERWPALPASEAAPESPMIRSGKLASAYAEAASGLALAEKKWTLSLGPSIEWSHLGDQAGVRAGALFSFPFPILESHAATATLAERTRVRGKTESTTQMREIQGEYEHSRGIYIATVAKLSGMRNWQSSRDRTREIRSRFERGLISGPTYLESLRQSLALLQSEAELESKAISAWCRVQALTPHFEACFL